MADFDHNRFASKTIEWETPRSLFDPLNAEFQFTLDVCATAHNAKCEKYYDQDADGLRQPWAGVCWMNPPYGRAMVSWLARAARERENGVTTVALIPARTNTGWWHDIVLKHGEVRFVRGRPRFNNADHGLPFPLAVVVFRATTKRARAALFDHAEAMA